MPDDPEVRQQVASPGPECDSSTFGDALHAELGPEIERLEAERVSCRQEISRRLGIGFRVILVTFVFPPSLLIGFAIINRGFGALTADALKLFLLPLPVVFVLVVIYCLWASEPGRTFIASYKTTILSTVAKAVGGFQYVHDGMIPMERLEPSSLIPGHDFYESEDLFRGAYKGVDVELAEARLTKLVTYKDEKGRISTRRILVFSGLFVLYSMNKRFSGRTVVCSAFGVPSGWGTGDGGWLERVELEDPIFEQRFEVFADDQIESRYLLTPAFMVRLTAVADDFATDSMQAAFYDKQLLLMIPLAKDRFEPPAINVSLIDDSGVKRLACELGDVLSIVDALKLDERTGL